MVGLARVSGKELGHKVKRGKLLCDNSRVVDGEIVHYDIGLGVPALLLVVEDELMECIGVFAARGRASVSAGASGSIRASASAGASATASATASAIAGASASASDDFGANASARVSASVIFAAAAASAGASAGVNVKF